MILDIDRLSHKDRYKLVTGTVAPRPIAWVSTISESGSLNLAPFSYFTVAAIEPLTLLFCPQAAAPGVKKDTLRNIEEVPEFVINLPNEETAAAMNLTATPLPPGRSEFEWAALTPTPSETIRVPRVAEAPVAFECALQQIVRVGEGSGGGAVVFGRVLRAHLRDDIYVNGYIQIEQLRPIGRLAGAAYTRVTNTFELARVPAPATE